MTRVLLVCGFAFLACPGDSPRTIVSLRFSGCAKVLRGPRCVLRPDGVLRIWASSLLVFHGDGKPLANRSHAEREGGHLYVLALPQQLEAFTSIDPESATFELPLVRRVDPLGPALELRKRGQLTAAAAEAEPMLRARDPFTRADALSLLARLQLQRGEFREARRALEQSQKAQLEAQCHSCAGQDATAAAYIDIIHLRDMASARASLSTAARLSGQSELGAQVVYMQALLSLRSGDLRGALAQLETARAAAARLDMQIDEAAAREVQATTLLRLGLYDDAHAQLLVLERSRTSACDQARVLSNMGRAGVLAIERDATSDTRQRTRLELEESLRLVRGPCPRPAEASDVLLLMARLDLERGDLDGARARLLEAEQQVSEPSEQLNLWSANIAGRIALAEARPVEALQIFEQSARHAGAVQSADAQWRARLGEARALAAMGQTGQAERAYAASERILERELKYAPLNLGLDTFLDARSPAQAEYLELLLAQGRAADAFEVARRARRRVLESVSRTERIAQLTSPERAAWERAVASYQRGRDDLARRQKDDWQLAGSTLARELETRSAVQAGIERDFERALSDLDLGAAGSNGRPIAPGELVVMLHALTDGVVLMTARDERVGSHIFRLDPRRDSEALLEAIRSELRPMLRGMGTLRAIVSGAVEHLDLHGVLLDDVAVEYSLDLATPAPRSDPRVALIVGDARDDLPFAHREALATRPLLATYGVPDVRLWLGATADAPSLAAALPALDVLHVAGHGEFSSRSWHNTLSLAAGTSLSVGDVIAAERVPQLVFLAGCETSRSSVTGPVQSLSLAHAFVTSGAGAVIATTRVVRDETTQEITRAFYRALATHRGNAVQALRTAQQEMRQLDSRADWAAFRVMTP